MGNNYICSHRRKSLTPRLEEAELTPALMMNGGNDGIAQSTGVASAHVNFCIRIYT